MTRKDGSFPIDVAVFSSLLLISLTSGCGTLDPEEPLGIRSDLTRLTTPAPDRTRERTSTTPAASKASPTTSDPASLAATRWRPTPPPTPPPATPTTSLKTASPSSKQWGEMIPDNRIDELEKQLLTTQSTARAASAPLPPKRPVISTQSERKPERTPSEEQEEESSSWGGIFSLFRKAPTTQTPTTPPPTVPPPASATAAPSAPLLARTAPPTVAPPAAQPDPRNIARPQPDASAVGAAQPPPTAPRSEIPATTTTTNPLGRTPAPNATTTEGKTDPILRPGLVLKISVLASGRKEVDETAKRISPNGSITLPLIGTVKAADMSLPQFAELLRSRYGEFMQSPMVDVDFVLTPEDVAGSPWGYVTVLGRIKKPGRVSIPPTQDLTLSMAIQLAGGLDTSAKLTGIKITRENSGNPEQFEVDLQSVGIKGESGSDVRLLDGDMVYVPERVF